MKLLKNLKNRIEYYNPQENSYAVQFCMDSSLHGLQFVGQQNRHCVERILWLVAFIASVVCAGLLINQLWESYNDSPIVTVFSSQDLPMQRIAFPSITICNLSRLKISKLKEYISNFYNMKEPQNQTQFSEAIRPLRDLLHFCKIEVFRQPIRELFPDHYTAEETYKNLTEDLKKFSKSDPLGTYPQHLTDSAQPCEEMISHCNGEHYRPCRELFRPILTDFGNCCVFNMIPLSLLIKKFNDSRDDTVENREWKKNNMTLTSEHLILPPNKLRHSPFFWQKGLGKLNELSVVLEPNLKEYSSCGMTDSDGFLVGLNSPLAYPRMEESVLHVPPGMKAVVQISPQITIAEKSIKKFSHEKRKCYFDDEVEQILVQHTKYTQTNCVNECISELTEALDCAPIYNMSKSLNLTTCDSWRHGTRYLEQDSYFHCSHCYPPCTDIQFQALLTALPVTKTNLSECSDSDTSCKKKTSDAAMVYFTFGQPLYQVRVRKEMYTVIDLISSTGGLLGLCMGFSMLSLLEILYYSTLRLCCIYRRKFVEKENSKLDLSPALYFGEIGQNISKKRARAPATIGDSQDPIFKLVQSRSAWRLKI